MLLTHVSIVPMYISIIALRCKDPTFNNKTIKKIAIFGRKAMTNLDSIFKGREVLQYVHIRDELI